MRLCTSRALEELARNLRTNASMRAISSCCRS